MATSTRSVLFVLSPVNMVFVLALAAISWLLIFVYQKRKMLAGLPQPPMRWKILGHILIAAECERHFPSDAHPHAYAHYIRKKYNLGSVFYVDFWPLGPRFCFVADPELASQYATTTQSLPKSPLTNDYLFKLLGRNNLVSLEGQKWKTLRSMFNPGFASAHLMTLVPFIVDQSLVFCEILREVAEKGELIEMEELATRLTVDIIGKIVLESDFNSQRSENPIVNTFRKQVSLMPPTSINPFAGLDPLRNLKAWLNGRKLDRLIGEELDRKFSAAAISKATSNGTTNSAGKPSRKDRKRSVVDLALEAYWNESTPLKTTDTTAKTATQTPTMDATFRRISIDSIKTFIFAGHDTTSSTIACVFYLLHAHPRVHKKLSTELSSIFGPDPSPAATADQIREAPHIINSLPYTTAVIKETLRLFPPASTLRDVVNSHLQFPTIPDPTTNQPLPLHGFTIWPIAHLIHRNEAFFPRAPEFIPERFLPDQTPFSEGTTEASKLFTPAGKDAWRPFEKGPRNCVGQELAMLETKVILAMVVRAFDFEAEFDGVRVGVGEEEEDVNGEKNGVICESVDEKSVKGKGTRGTIEGRRCYQILRGSAKPVGGMPGRVKLR